MNLETKITIYKFTPQLFTLTPSQSEHEEFPSATPLNWLRKALILALNDSAEAFVNRSSK